MWKNLTDTEARQIPGLEGYYITEDAQVLSYKRRQGNRWVIDTNSPPLMMKPQRNTSSGRYQIELHGKKYLLHRLVAMTFIPNPHNLPEVNHIDEDPSNNIVSNLEWCDRQYNASYSLSKPRRVLHVKSNTIFEVKNVREWCRLNEIDAATLYKTSIDKYKDKTTKGYKLLGD
jgi:hypothetical protein